MATGDFRILPKAHLLQLTLFGSPEVRLHGQAVTGFRSSKAQALLYYLAVTGRPHTRPTLAGLFWGDQPEAAARTSLRKCLSNLHELVGDALLIERQTVAFNPDHLYQLDTERFLAGVATPPTPETIRSLQATLLLYRGDFLEGFYVRDAPDFEQWVLLQRAYYRELVINGLHTLANWCDQQGDLAQAITHTRRLLALEPWREEAHRQLMRRLARSGQRGAALRQYEECECILRAELDVAPAPETVALWQQIKQTPPEPGAPLVGKTPLPVNASLTANAPPASARTNLPLAVTSFIGRQREMREVKRLLLGEEGRRPGKLVTLTGAGGSGKTRLAFEVASLLLPLFPDGVWWVDLAPLRDDATVVPQTVAKALGLVETPNQTLTDTLTQFLANKQLLLVLDNCERLVDACAQLTSALIRRCPTVQIVTTSRQLLGITGEQVYPVPTLTLPDPDESTLPARLLSSEAVQLFVERSQALRPSFQLSEQNAAAVVQICCKLDGIPLALELAAARVRLLRVDQIARRLDERLHLLTAGDRSAAPHHQTLRATIDWSYDLLTEAERQLLRRLAVFAGSFSLDAVEQVCAPLPTSILDLLAHLVDKSLVVVERDGEEAEYRLLDTIREYAFEKLVTAGEETQRRMHHLNYFTQLAETAYTQLLGNEQKQWLAQLERAHDNLRIALTWTIDQAMCIEALRLSGVLGYFWDIHGHWSEGRQWSEQALLLRHTADGRFSDGVAERSWHARALWQAGNFRWRQHDLVGARTLLQESHDLYQALNDKTGIGHVLSHLGWVLLELGELVEAQTIFNTCLAVRLEVGDKQALGSSFFNIGMMALVRGDFTNGQIALKESLKLWREVGDQRNVILPLIMLGEIANLHGNYRDALTLYDEGLVLGRELGEKRAVADALASIANVWVKLSDVETARTLYLESLSLYSELGNQRGVATVLSALARIRQILGQLQRAAQIFGASAALITAIHGSIGEPEISDQQRTTALLRTQLDEASFNAAWEQGRSLTLEQAIALAQQNE